MQEHQNNRVSIDGSTFKGISIIFGPGSKITWSLGVLATVILLATLAIKLLPSNLIANKLPPQDFYEIPKGELSGDIELSEGGVSVLPGYVVIQADKDNSIPYVSLKLTIKSSDYYHREVKVDRSFTESGLLAITGENQNFNRQQFDFTDKGSDLLLIIEEAGTTKNSFMKARIKGTMTNGKESKKVDIKIKLLVY